MRTTIDEPAATEPESAGAAPPEPAGPQARPRLIVWSSDPAAADPLLRALEQGFALDCRGDMPDPATVQAGAEAPRMLLLCRAPVPALAAAMAAGTPPPEALAAWMDQARALLALNRRNRRRVHVLDIGHALGNFAAFREHFGLPGPSAEMVAPAADAVLRLVARQALLGDGQARAMAGEMDAVALDLGVAPAAEDPTAAFRAHADAERERREAGELRDRIDRIRENLHERDRALAAAAAERDGAREEVRLLQEQNRAVQAQAETLAGDKMRLEAEVQQAGEANDRARANVRLLRDQAGRMQAEIARMEHSGAQLEERLEQLRQGIDSQQAQIATLEAERDRLEAGRARLEADRAGLTRRIGGKEQALVAAAAAMRELEARVAELDGRLDRVRGDRAAVRQRLADRQRQVDALAARVEAFEASRYFRWVAALRRFGTRISGGGRT